MPVRIGSGAAEPAVVERHPHHPVVLGGGDVDEHPLVLVVRRGDREPEQPGLALRRGVSSTSPTWVDLAVRDVQDAAAVALGDQRRAVGQERDAPRHREVGPRSCRSPAVAPEASVAEGDDEPTVSATTGSGRRRAGLPSRPCSVRRPGRLRARRRAPAQRATSARSRLIPASGSQRRCVTSGDPVEQVQQHLVHLASASPSEMKCVARELDVRRAAGSAPRRSSCRATTRARRTGRRRSVVGTSIVRSETRGVQRGGSARCMYQSIGVVRNSLIARRASVRSGIGSMKPLWVSTATGARPDGEPARSTWVQRLAGEPSSAGDVDRDRLARRSGARTAARSIEAKVSPGTPATANSPVTRSGWRDRELEHGVHADRPARSPRTRRPRRRRARRSRPRRTPRCRRGPGQSGRSEPPTPRWFHEITRTPQSGSSSAGQA